VAPATGDGAQMPAPGAEPGLAVEPAGRECALGLPGLPGLMAPDTEDRAAPRPAIHSLILDFSPVNLVDTVAVKTLKTAMAGLGAMGLEVCIAACQDCVLEQLHSCGFFTPGVTETGTATDPAGADPGRQAVPQRARGCRPLPAAGRSGVRTANAAAQVHTELG
ncbi:prestin-like, partial [Lethenteron reissneri]|uniref:prestin-like n=1 Tax=Lethenteron reissneri TaxID=7753 RepID=UPI002AB6551A